MIISIFSSTCSLCIILFEKQLKIQKGDEFESVPWVRRLMGGNKKFDFEDRLEKEHINLDANNHLNSGLGIGSHIEQEIKKNEVIRSKETILNQLKDQQNKNIHKNVLELENKNNNDKEFTGHFNTINECSMINDNDTSKIENEFN